MRHRMAAMPRRAGLPGLWNRTQRAPLEGRMAATAYNGAGPCQSLGANPIAAWLETHVPVRLCRGMGMAKVSQKKNAFGMVQRRTHQLPMPNQKPRLIPAAALLRASSLSLSAQNAWPLRSMARTHPSRNLPTPRHDDRASPLTKTPA